MALALAGLLAAALLGAFLFGFWHVRAGGTAVAMALEVAIVRRWLASAGPPKSP